VHTGRIQPLLGILADRLQAPAMSAASAAPERGQQGGPMYKSMFAVVIAAGLIAAPLPPLTQTAAAQTTQPAAPATTTKTKKPPTPGQLAARERQKKCGAEWKAAKAAGKVE